MSTNHHTAITTSAPGESGTVNDPLGELDAAIETKMTGNEEIFNYNNTLPASPSLYDTIMYTPTAGFPMDSWMVWYDGTNWVYADGTTV